MEGRKSKDETASVRGLPLTSFITTKGLNSSFISFLFSIIHSSLLRTKSRGEDKEKREKNL